MPAAMPAAIAGASPRTFFAGLTAKRQRKAAVPSSNPCVTEVDNYLHGRSQQRTVIIIQISKHPEIVRQIKHRFASQCCRRKTFFSGWQSFHTITRQHDHEHFDMLVFLRAFERGL
jgi:hypothetical protein